MADKSYAPPQKDKRGGYSGSKPGRSMGPPAKFPSGLARNGQNNPNGSRDDKK